MIEIDAHEWDAGGPGEPPGAIMVSKGVDAALGKRQTLLPAGPDRKERSIVRRPWLLPGCMGTMEQPVMAPMVSRRERQGSQRE